MPKRQSALIHHWLANPCRKLWAKLKPLKSYPTSLCLSDSSSPHQLQNPSKLKCIVLSADDWSKDCQKYSRNLTASKSHRVLSKNVKKKSRYNTGVTKCHFSLSSHAQNKSLPTMPSAGEITPSILNEAGCTWSLLVMPLCIIWYKCTKKSLLGSTSWCLVIISQISL